MNIINTSGSKIDPCGIPLKTSSVKFIIYDTSQTQLQSYDRHFATRRFLDRLGEVVPPGLSLAAATVVVAASPFVPRVLCR